MFAATVRYGIERVVLEDHRHVAVLRRDIGDVALADVDPAGVDLLEPGQHAQRGRLPRAGRPDEDHELPVRDVQVERVDRGLVVPRVDARRLPEVHLSHRPPPRALTEPAPGRLPWRPTRRARAARPRRSAASPSPGRRLPGSPARIRSTTREFSTLEQPAAEQNLDLAAVQPEPVDRSAARARRPRRRAGRRSRPRPRRARPPRRRPGAARARDAPGSAHRGSPPPARSGVSKPKCAGTARSSVVSAPRPSKLRAALKTAASPTS